MSLPIEQYGMIGDCQTAAIVGSNGSIDWLCFPSFESPACLAALLGGRENGRWLLAPVDEPKEVRRKYRGDTLILETEFHTSEGVVTVIDCMPPRTGEPDLIRMVVGKQGKVRMRMDMVVRFDYGSILPWIQSYDHSIRAVAGPDTVTLDTPVELKEQDGGITAEFTVEAGEQIPFVMMWYESHKHRPKRIDAKRAIEETETWWNDWSSRCTYDGPWREAVMRSLITLKAQTYAPTGGIVAAPTTSLPESLGGVRNWDYRFCWIRDATFTLYSLLHNGYVAEAKEFRDWLLRAVAGDPRKLQIMYSILGRRRLTEWEVDWLSGYENSQPVRVGNAACKQFQLDVFGELFDMLHLCRREKLPEDDAAWEFERAVLSFLEDAWSRPDEGIWEVRGPRRHFTHSKAMAWVAFDRAIKTVEKLGRDGPLDRWKKIRSTIHQEVCEKGFNQKLNSFVQYYDADLLDASLLMLPLVGFLPADDPRIRGTVDAIERDLLRDGFVHRYATQKAVDGLPAGEASFLPCSFWFVDNLALQGRRDEAEQMFERLLSIRNELGLLSEEYDIGTKRLIGNFPQAFSHVALVNSARNLATTEGPAKDRPQTNGSDRG